VLGVEGRLFDQRGHVRVVQCVDHLASMALPDHWDMPTVSVSSPTEHGAPTQAQGSA
jgi:hypothetical protein